MVRGYHGSYAKPGVETPENTDKCLSGVTLRCHLYTHNNTLVQKYTTLVQTNTTCQPPHLHLHNTHTHNRSIGPREEKEEKERRRRRRDAPGRRRGGGDVTVKVSHRRLWVSVVGGGVAERGSAMEAEPHGRTMPRWYSTGVGVESNPNPSPEKRRRENKKNKKKIVLAPDRTSRSGGRRCTRARACARVCTPYRIGPRRAGSAARARTRSSSRSGPTRLGRPDPNKNKKNKRRKKEEKKGRKNERKFEKNSVKIGKNWEKLYVDKINRNR
ncbi:hypothetical protein Scep_010135 [Stephania cephalantha]|uniref:Uncharacterized protein n=1 Tax=Stephania cephalantha TaxID=152367 RepID=A0AAP0PEX9_9MAGN